MPNIREPGGRKVTRCSRSLSWDPKGDFPSPVSSSSFAILNLDRGLALCGLGENSRVHCLEIPISEGNGGANWTQVSPGANTHAPTGKVGEK